MLFLLLSKHVVSLGYHWSPRMGQLTEVSFSGMLWAASSNFLLTLLTTHLIMLAG